MKKKGKRSIWKKAYKALQRSPINFFSDLFIIAMVLFWIIDNMYETLVATAVTISSIVLSFQVGCSCIDTSMWSSIGSNIAIPLSAGGALWMLKNGVQHAIFNRKGTEAPADFPQPETMDSPDGPEG